MKNQVFMRKHVVAAVLVGLGLHLGAAQAGPFLTDKAFDLTVGVGPTTVYDSATDKVVAGAGGTVSAPFGATNLQALKDQITDAGLKQINASYDPVALSAVAIRAGYRGLPIVLSSGASSNTVSLNIPAIGLSKAFSAKSTRDDNTKDLFEYLKSDGGDIINQLQQKLALLSPVDPIAGNPSSMQSRMVMDDFDRSFTAFASNVKGDSGSGNSNLVGVGLSLGSMTTGGINTTTTTVPLSYTVRNDLDPRKQFSFYAPVTSSDTAGAKVYGVNLGAAYRFPVNDDWALTPALGYGVTGSEDLGSGASMFAASLTSQYSWKMDGYDLAMGNMVGVYQSTQLNAGDYSIDPKISNTVFRNGILASFPMSTFGQKMALEVSFILTNYTGTALYSNQYQEIGLTLGTNKSANSARSYVRAGATYLTGENGITGYKLNVGYWF